MKIKMERLAYNDIHELKRIRFTVNGQVHDLRVGSRHDELDHAYAFHIHSVRRLGLKAQRSPATTGPADVALCSWMEKQFFHV